MSEFLTALERLLLFFIMAQRAGGTGVMIPEKSRCPTLTPPTSFQGGTMAPG